jgi:hypothetical protein
MPGFLPIALPVIASGAREQRFQRRLKRKNSKRLKRKKGNASSKAAVDYSQAK